MNIRSSNTFRIGKKRKKYHGLELKTPVHLPAAGKQAVFAYTIIYCAYTCIRKRK